MDFLKKEEILDFMRGEVKRKVQELQSASLTNQDKTKDMNKLLDSIRDSLFLELKENYSNTEEYPLQTAGAFLVYYCWIIVSIECRNTIWNYESMDLSRRSGELWESLVKQCWTYPVYSTVKRFEAPKFEDVSETIKNAFNKNLLEQEIESNVVDRIYEEYSIIWSLLGDSINLDSDELFETTFVENGIVDKEDKIFIIDFKGSYGSNEKGNKERLLTVARVYDLLNHYHVTNKSFDCMLAVRTVEAGGHNYLRQLESSGLWSVLRGNEVYQMVHEYTGFDVLSFISDKELSIIGDLNEETAEYMVSKITSKQRKTFAEHYLTWW